MHWTVCYENSCYSHEEEKQTEYYSTAPAKYWEKKTALWAVSQAEHLNKKNNIEEMLTISEESELERKSAEARLRNILCAWAKAIWSKQSMMNTLLRAIRVSETSEVSEISEIQKTRILKIQKDKNQSEMLKEVSTNEDKE